MAIMAEREEGAPMDPNAPEKHAIDAKSADADWESALRELEQLEARRAKMRALRTPAPIAPPASSMPTPRPVAMPTPRPVVATPPSAAPATPQQIVARFSEILSAINTSMNQLRKFEANHPTIIAPNVYRVWEDGLKEASLVMFREFTHLRQRLVEETGEEV